MRRIDYVAGMQLPTDFDWVGYCNNPDTDMKARGLGFSLQLLVAQNILIQKAIRNVVDDVQLDVKIPEMENVTLRQLLNR